MSAGREFVDTGIEWLDRLPKGWSAATLGRESWVRARLGWKGLKAEEYVDEGGFPMLSTPDIKSRDINFQSAARITKARFDESPEIMLQVDDVLLTKDGSTIGTANIVRDLPEPTTLNGSIALLTPSKNLDGRFLYYVTVSRYAQAIFDLLRGGAGVPHLFQRDINQIRIPLPPIEEQRAIADYLDQEAAQIDALVAKQEEFIGVLRERRQSQVADAFGPAGPVGTQLRRVAHIQTGVTLSGEGKAVDPTWPYLRVANVQMGRVDLSSVKEIRLPHADAAASLLRPGDVLMTEGGDIDKLGRGTVWDGRISPMVHQNHVFAVRANLKRLSPHYLAWWLETSVARKYFYLTAKKTTNLASTNKTVVGRLPMPVPSLNLQDQIVSHLDEQTSRIDTLIAKAEEHIALAKERRAALITAAVTGQIDVRTAAQKVS